MENENNELEITDENKEEVKETKVFKNPPAFVKPSSFKNPTGFKWNANNFSNNKQRPWRAASRWR